MDVRFTEYAVRDILAIRLYTRKHFGAQQERQVVLRINSVLRQLARFPLSGTLHGSQTFRAVRVVDTPFMLVYRLNDGIIEVMTCFHGAQQWPEL